MCKIYQMAFCDWLFAVCVTELRQKIKNFLMKFKQALNSV